MRGIRAAVAALACAVGLGAHAQSTINWALESNGGIASASSELGGAFPAAAINDGERAGRAWSQGGGWAGATADRAPWVQIDFNGMKTLTDVVVYSVQDNWQSPVEPTDTMTFTRYGITAFDLQVWNGTGWVTLASVTGNNLVKRKVSIFPHSTTKVRIVVKGALGGYARITELEADAIDQPNNFGYWLQKNYALASMGATAIASSQLGAAFPVSSIIDGDLRGTGWASGGGWADGTPDAYPDWVEVDLPAAQPIDHVTVYTVQDDWQMPATPTDSTTFTQYGIVDFNVQGWDGTQWVTLGTVTNNNLVKRTVQFASAYTTGKIRVNVTRSLGGLSRITELQAWAVTNDGQPTFSYDVAESAGSAASASSVFGSLYLPSNAINTDTSGQGWGATSGCCYGGWADATVGQFPDWLQVDFNSVYTIDHVVVYSLQDNWQSPMDSPPDTLTFTQYGIVDFDVDGWDGAQWIRLGSVRGNNQVNRSVSFSPFTTSKVRVTVLNALNGLSRIVELQAWTVPATKGAPTNVSVGVSSSVDEPAAGQAITFTATVAGVGPTPSGTVTFNDGSTVICPAVALSIGTATCATGALAPGAHSITATYSGDTSYNPATSAGLAQTVESGTNVALASNGSTASASSQYGSGFPVSAIIDGDATGANWTNGGGWADASPGQYPDWVEIDFPVAEHISKVVIYTLQDNWQSPSRPTDAMTFTQYGITDFDVQAWDGSQWVTLTSIFGNNHVKSTVSFTGFTTTKIRVVVNNALGNLARITEVQAWGAPAGSGTGTNFALASSGGFASASSQFSGSFPVGSIIDGDRKGTNWSAGGGWADATPDAYPDWVQIDFAGMVYLNTINVYTLQDNWQSPAEPTDAMTFSQYGVTDFAVQIWDGTQWQDLATVTGNRSVKRSVPVSIGTRSIRIKVTGAMSSFSRITEVEAWGNWFDPAPF